MLLSSHGYGWIGYPLFGGAVFLGPVAERMRPGTNLLGMGIGFIVVGVVMFIAGRRLNRPHVLHRFCEMRLERWIYLSAPLGVLMAMVGLRASGLWPAPH